MRILTQLSPTEFEFAYAYPVVGNDHSARTLETICDGPWFPIRYLAYTKKTRWHYARCAINFSLAFVDAVRILRKWRPRIILAVGCASAVPLFAVARVLGIRTVFIESLTRTQELSTTGKLIHRLRLASRLFVQWPQLLSKYPGTEFEGAVV
jgi:UDP-N-acetylglucosamine:LPS N-acetylglucosamine transferase